MKNNDMSCCRSENTKSKNAKNFIPLVLLLPALPLYFNLEKLTDLLVYGVFHMTKESKIGDALYFFIYEVPKVLILLTIIVFIVGIVRSFFSAAKTRAFLEGKPLFIGNILAALLGIVTPFCSCSAIPLFLGFIEAGIPLGVTFSFLISAPMINEVALVLLFGLFGWKTALLYAGTGLFIAIFAGWLIGILKLERFVESWVYNVKMGESAPEEKLNWNNRLAHGLTAVKEIVSKVWLYILLGIALGSFIHGYVPQNMMAAIMGKDAWWSVPAAVALGVPMYSNAAGIVPVIQALIAKGAALGTALAFMMAVIGLSLPEMIILRKVLKLQMIIIFAGIVAAGIMIVGFIFNMAY